jgi:hypothetical protein
LKPQPLEIIATKPYCSAMSIFRDVSLKGSGSDLIAFLRTPREHRWLLALLASAPPLMIVGMFNSDILERTKPGPPEIIYIESWPADRSIAEIIKSNEARQKIEDEQQAKMREAYKALGRASGMDVDRIEREAEAARAAKAKAAAAAIEAKTATAGASK